MVVLNKLNFINMSQRVKRWLKGVVVDVHPSVSFGKDTYVWSFAVICEGTTIGDNCVIGSGVFIGKHCRIGNNVRIQSKAFLVNQMVVKDDVFIGPCAVTMDDKYPVVNNSNYKKCPPFFEKGCSIGANAMILPGVRIGHHAMVGAGAVVTKDVLPGVLVVGCPAISKGKLSKWQ